MPRVDSGQPPEPPEDAQSVTRPLEPQYCPAGHEVAVTARFCPECGQPVATEPVLTDWTCGLGHPCPAEAKFCSECGTPRAVSSALPSYAVDPRPRPDSELTPEELAARERAHAQALRMGREDPAITYEEPPSGARTILIHFVEDGFSVFGQVWYRGQEIELPVGSPRYWEAVRWIHLDDFAQLDKYGKVYYRPGPWRGKRYSDADPGDWAKLRVPGGEGEVGPPTREQLEEADKAEQRRRRGVPQPTIR